MVQHEHDNPTLTQDIQEIPARTFESLSTPPPRLREFGLYVARDLSQISIDIGGFFGFLKGFAQYDRMVYNFDGDTVLAGQIILSVAGGLALSAAIRRIARGSIHRPLF